MSTQKTRFRYIDVRGYAHYFVASGVSYRGNDLNCYYTFEANPYSDRPTTGMAFSYDEMKRLHEFLGTTLDELKREAAADSLFAQRLEGANAYIKSLTENDLDTRTNRPDVCS